MHICVSNHPTIKIKNLEKIKSTIPMKIASNEVTTITTHVAPINSSLVDQETFKSSSFTSIRNFLMRLNISPSFRKLQFTLPLTAKIFSVNYTLLTLTFLLAGLEGFEPPTRRSAFGFAPQGGNLRFPPMAL